MLARIRDIKGQGNAAVFVRARDVQGRYWSWSGSAWATSETTATQTFLTEYADADSIESGYAATITPPAGDVVLEYVRASSSVVIGEETPDSYAIRAAVTTGVGAGVLTVTVRNESAAAVDAALVSLKDTASATIVAQGSTSVSGVVVLAHEGGAFQLITVKAGMAFSVASVSLTSGQVASQTITGATVGSVTPAADPLECTLYATVRDLDGTAKAGVAGSVYIDKLPLITSGNFVHGDEVEATSDANGLISWTVPRGARLVVNVPYVTGRDVKVSIPDATTADLATLLS